MNEFIWTLIGTFWVAWITFYLLQLCTSIDGVRDAIREIRDELRRK